MALKQVEEGIQGPNWSEVVYRRTNKKAIMKVARSITASEIEEDEAALKETATW